MIKGILKNRGAIVAVLALVAVAYAAGVVYGPKVKEQARSTGPALAQAPAPTGVAALQDDFSGVAEKAKPAVVTIRQSSKVKASQVPQVPPDELPWGDFFNFPWPFGDQPPRVRVPQTPRVREGEGSGFVVSPDGYIVTNEHVVAGADRIDVTFPNDPTTYSAKVVGSDPRTDLALIRVDRQNLPYLELADSDQVKVGQWAISIGNPFGVFEQSVTVGIVSALGRDIGTGRVGQPGSYTRYIQTDAAINQGNSGGPLLDIYGRVMGVNSQIYSPTGTAVGLGFAVPSNVVRDVVDQLKASGKVVRGWLGVVIQELSPALKERFGVNEGVLVAQVEKGGPADKAGIKEGDVIMSFNGQAATSPPQLQQLVASYGPNKSAELVLTRDKKSMRVTLTTGELPKPEATQEPQANFRVLPRGQRGNNKLSQPVLGLTVVPLDSAWAAAVGLKEAEAGVVVVEVATDSNAYGAGIRPGVVVLEINGRTVRNLEEFQAEAGKIKAGDAVALKLWLQPGVTLYRGFYAGGIGEQR